MAAASPRPSASWPTPEEVDDILRRADALAKEPASARRRTALALARLATAASRGEPGAD